MTAVLPVARSARMAAFCLNVPGAYYHLANPLSWRLVPLDEQGGEVASGTALTTLLLLNGLRPDTDYRLLVETIEPVEFTTRPCAGLINAADFGLTADIALDDQDGARANSAALAQAVAAVPVGGTLLLPAGIWTSLPLALKSWMTLSLAAGAVLRAPAGRSGWPILPARDAAGQMFGSWEGLPAACFAAPLHAIGAEDLTIEGAGLLDGSGDQGDWWHWPKETREGARRPRGLHLINCRNTTLLGFQIRNAASWTIHPQGCTGLTAAGLTISAPPDSPNTDGFNPESCRDVTIAGVRFSVGDDCIAIKAGKRGDQGEDDHLAETRGVYVHHCLMERGHGGLVIGSEMSGGVHDVRVEDCEMIGTDRGLRLKTRRGRGGVVSKIAMRRVKLRQVETALYANAHYHCDHDGHDDWVQSRAPAPVTDRTPVIAGITLEDIDLYGLRLAAAVCLGLPESPLRQITIRRLTIHSFDDQAIAAAPIMADRVRLMRHETIVAEQAEIDCDDPALLSGAAVSLPAAE